MTSPPWFRFYSEALNDRKILRVCRETGMPKALVIGVWTTILALASDSPRRGLLLFTDDIPLTFEDLALETGMDDGPLDELLSTFNKFEMLGQVDGVYCVTNWDKRQFASDHSTARVQEWRERQKQNGDEKEEGNDTETLEGNEDETLQQQLGNAPEAESETETETETAKASQKKRQPARKRSTNTSEARAMFSALANLCQISIKTLTKKQRDILNQSESRLRGAGARPADMDAFSEWWSQFDWRGRGDEKQGRPSVPPQPHQVREEWGKFETWRNGRKSVQPKHITVSR